MRMRRRVWEIVEVAHPGDRASRAFDVFILVLIFLNVLAAILGTVGSVEATVGGSLRIFEVLSVAVFTVEYAARLWSCVEDPRFSHPFRGRAAYARRGLLVIDLVAVLPFYLPFLGLDLRSLRVLRLLRVLRIAKIGRYYSSLDLMRRVFVSKREELVLVTALMALLLVLSASVLYFCENPHQPDVFSSIPATMWWSIATLTTVGYGDMYPVTVLGKVFASIIAILGIGMFALPTGILGAGFVDELQRSREEGDVCPLCGRRKL
ncbi:MAG: ion transporter [Candidatus Krumholzibacteriia bacterium]